jgi:hypothetical protein
MQRHWLGADIGGSNRSDGSHRFNIGVTVDAVKYLAMQRRLSGAMSHQG